MKKFFAMIAIVAMSVFVSEAYGQSAAAEKPYADQVKEAVELITKAVNEKNGDTLVEGLKAYAATFDSAKSMDEIIEVSTQYNIDQLLPAENELRKWVNDEQIKQIQEINIEGAMEKALTRLL
ncbi:MAG: hypothetical protein HUK14_09770 [Muribaculaceae bacterium]|nr:hypothetical protein [Muribaculaceae bacterium]